jgi:membrane protease YdiL (CAAX protease family)
MTAKTKIFTRSLILLFGIYILLGLLRLLLVKLYPQFSQTDYQQSQLQNLLQSNPLRAGIMIILVAPVIEELMFRSLIKPSHTDLVLFIAAWPVFIAATCIPPDVHWFFKVCFLAVVLACLTYIGTQLINPFKGRHLRSKISSWYIPIWILTSILFGLVHITNYVETFTLNIPLFLLIVPRIVAGFIFGYIKIKNKHLGWSIAMHSMNNAIPISMLLLAH